MTESMSHATLPYLVVAGQGTLVSGTQASSTTESVRVQYSPSVESQQPGPQNSCYSRPLVLCLFRCLSHAGFAHFIIYRELISCSAVSVSGRLKRQHPRQKLL
jgi:hypothetical protein